MPTSQSLKDEGNQLFSAKNFAEASKKYSDAIAAEGGSTNAVLYANRAACRLNLKQYLDAVADAKKATVLDPLYVKAWARLATGHDAIGEPWHSVPAWKKAIELLPEENASEAQRKQRKEYQTVLKSSQAALRYNRERPSIGVTISNRSEMPWQAAARLIPRLRADGEKNSSAWVIYEANEAFECGNRILNSGSLQTAGDLEESALEAYTDAMLMDDRVFRIQDQNWVEKYNVRAIAEAQMTGAWVTGGPEEIITKVKVKQAQDGFQAARKALSITLRGYLMRGLIESGLRQNSVLCVEMARRVLDIIKWAREEWKDIPDEERGREYTPEFERQVRIVLLNNAEKTNSTNEDLAEMKKIVDEVYECIEKYTLPNLDEVKNPGFALATNHYVRGRTLAVLGMWNNQMGIREKDQDKKHKYFQTASKAYKESADYFPEDDECSAWFRSICLQNLYRAGPTPAWVFLETMDAVDLASAHMKQIWTSSALAMGGRDAAINQTMETGGNIRDAHASGQLKDEGVISLNMP